MYSAPQRYLMLSALLLVAPVLALASSITVNGTCEAGTCPPTDTLAPGGSVPFTLFGFDVVVNGDTYLVSGNYKAANTTDSGGTTSFGGDVSAEYIGGSPTAQQDILTIDDLQNYTVPGTYNLAGTYDEGAYLGLIGDAAGSSASFQILYNGDSVGLLGPYTTSGDHTASQFLNLSGTSLSADSQFTFSFAAGTTKGALITTTPEPGGLVPLAAVLVLGLGLPAFRRSRQTKKIG